MNTIKKVIKKIKEGFLQKMLYELAWIYHILAEYRKAIVGFTLISLIGIGLSLFLSFQIKGLIDSLVSQEWSEVISVAVLYVCIGIINVVLNMITQRLSAKVSARAKTALSLKTYRSILKADWETVIEHHSGDLLTRIQEDILAISSSTVGWIPSVGISLMQIIACVVIILYYDMSMILIILIVAPVILIGSRIFLRKMYISNKKQRKTASAVMSLYKESFQHLQSIKGFGLGNYFNKKMYSQQMEREHIDLEVNKYSIASWGIMYISGQVAALICLGWAIFHVYQGKISIGTMALLVMLAGTVASSFKSFIQLIPEAIGTISSAERVRELLNLPEEKPENQEEYQRMRRDAQAAGVSIHFENINFNYKNGKEVFKNISYDVNAGEIVAFVGPSGEGKTTMLRILLGIVKVQGSIEIHSQNMKLPISSESRSLMSYVPQGNSMLNGTIAENMRMLNPEATDDDIITALKDACAYEFVSMLTDGIYHDIGESGIGFSEGQNQRLAIARSLMCKAPILLLDEATSALDVATERQVLANLMNSETKRTCILTTHRPSVLSMCNRVYRIANTDITEIYENEIGKLMNEF
ncbi:MAG: ABC transporter ATP-binding protein [Suipraeoptans sp.]